MVNGFIREGLCNGSESGSKLAEAGQEHGNKSRGIRKFSPGGADMGSAPPRERAHRAAKPEDDALLSEVVARWPSLSQSARIAIYRIMKASRNARP